VDAQTADAWFAELRMAVNWRSERRLMYEREVEVPRLMASYRLDVPSPSTPRRSSTPRLVSPNGWRCRSTASV
jgi:hypothetical protein